LRLPFNVVDGSEILVGTLRRSQPLSTVRRNSTLFEISKESQKESK
jgi:hypothetical protein